MYPKIPDEIYENRCKYCVHFVRDGENRDFEAREAYLHSTNPSCRIFTIAGYKYQIPLMESNRFAGHENVPFFDGECRTFAPRLAYPGICQSCAYHNCFVKGCPTEKRGDDYRRAFIANDHGSEEYASNFYTCSNWKIKDTFKDLLLEDIANGRAPNVIDLETFKLIKIKKVKPLKSKKKEPKAEQLAIDFGL